MSYCALGRYSKATEKGRSGAIMTTTGFGNAAKKMSTIFHEKDLCVKQIAVMTCLERKR